MNQRRLLSQFSTTMTPTEQTKTKMPSGKDMTGHMGRERMSPAAPLQGRA